MYAIYARVSTDEQNIAQQIEILTKFCKDKNLPYRTYADDGITGTTEDRPEWKRLLRHCETGRFDKILILKIDRVTRDLHYACHFYDWFKKMQEKKGEFNLISLYDNIDLNTPDGWFNFMLKCLLAQHELNQLYFRQRIGIERAKKEGKYKGRKIGSKNKVKSIPYFRVIPT